MRINYISFAIRNYVGFIFDVQDTGPRQPPIGCDRDIQKPWRPGVWERI